MRASVGLSSLSFGTNRAEGMGCPAVEQHVKAVTGVATSCVVSSYPACVLSTSILGYRHIGLYSLSSLEAYFAKACAAFCHSGPQRLRIGY